MNIRAVAYVLIILLNIFSTTSLRAVAFNLIGNDKTNFVSTTPNVTSSARGFVFFTQGVIFDGDVNVCLPVPISGNIQFGSGAPGATCKVILEADLTFGSTAGTSTNTIKINTITGSADIDGTGGTITFDSDTFFPSNRAIHVISNLTLDGGGHDIAFGDNMTFSIDAGVNLTIRDAHLRKLKDLNFVGAGSLTLYNTIVTLDNDWTFSGNASIGACKLIFDDFTIIKGKNRKFTYASGRDMLFISDAELTFDSGTTFSWGNHRRNGLVMDYIEYGMTGGGSSIVFNDSSIYVPSRGIDRGLQVNKGTFVFDNKCNVYNDGNTSVSKSLQFGDGSSPGNNSSIVLTSGATVEVDGYLYDASVYAD